MMSHGTHGTAQPGYPYVVDERYSFEDTGNRYTSTPPPSTSMDYYYPSVQISGHGQAHRPIQHQTHPSQQAYPTHDPRLIAQQTNQTLTALASARRFPTEYRADPNAQVGDTASGGHHYYGVLQREYHPPTGGSRTSSDFMYPPGTQASLGVAQTSSASVSLTGPRVLSPILKTSDGHACSYCGKTFGRPSAVKIHMAIHTGERAFTCPAPGCHRSFSVRSNMSRHIRNVHQGWPYEHDGELDSGNEGPEEIDDRARY